MEIGVQRNIFLLEPNGRLPLKRRLLCLFDLCFQMYTKWWALIKKRRKSCQMVNYDICLMFCLLFIPRYKRNML